MALSAYEISQVADLVMNRVRNMFSRGEIKKVTNGKTARAKVELLSGEIYEGIELPHQFGFQANPPVGSECLAIFLGGNRDHGSIIGSFNKAHSRPELESGESALFNQLGSVVKAKANGDITITTASGASVEVKNDGSITITAQDPISITAPSVVMTTPSVTMTEDLHVNGLIYGTVVP